MANEENCVLVHKGIINGSYCSHAVVTMINGGIFTPGLDEEDRAYANLGAIHAGNTTSRDPGACVYCAF